jgi:hypothetical protein
MPFSLCSHCAQFLDLDQLYLAFDSSFEETDTPWARSGCVIQTHSAAKVRRIEVQPLQLSSPLNSPTSLLASRLVRYLSINNPKGLSIRCLRSFLDFIPARLGINSALDIIVKCLCTTYSQMLTQNDDACKNDVKQYIKALNSLRRSLDKREVLSSEVLCSVVLLSWYEVR